MEQVTVLLREYLDYLPPELKDEQFITAATINNYVRIKVMPGAGEAAVLPRAYRVSSSHSDAQAVAEHALIQKVIPMGLSEEEVEHIYTAYASRHRQAAQYFIQQIRLTAGPILNHEENAEITTEHCRGSYHALGHHGRLYAGVLPKSSSARRKDPLERRQRRPVRRKAG